MQRHAYLIAAHKNYYVLERLLRAIDDPRNDVYLHVDKKVGDIDLRRLSELCTRSDVFLMPRMKVYWADYTQVRSAIAMMRAAKKSNRNYTYMHLLSDSDLPIKDQDTIHGFFQQNPDREFVAFNDPPRWAREWVDYRYPLNRLLRSESRLARLAYPRFRHIALSAQAAAKLRKRFPFEVKYGSDWFSISGDMAAYVSSREQWIERHFRSAFMPSEFYLQTVLWNSPFRERVFDLDHPYRSSMRHIDFVRQKDGSPHTFTIDDFEDLRRSERLFARKFDAHVDREIIDRVCALASRSDL